jgi:hypothetical protein
MHGNKKTEDELARDAQEREAARQAGAGVSGKENVRP